jgi:hypothetical protein
MTSGGRVRDIIGATGDPVPDSPLPLRGWQGKCAFSGRVFKPGTFRAQFVCIIEGCSLAFAQNTQRLTEMAILSLYPLPLVSYSHDASVALLSDTKVMFAYEEEKVSRLQYGMAAPPQHAGIMAFKASGVDPSSVDHVVITSARRPLGGLCPPLHPRNPAGVRGRKRLLRPVATFL